MLWNHKIKICISAREPENRKHFPFTPNRRKNSIASRISKTETEVNGRGEREEAPHPTMPIWLREPPRATPEKDKEKKKERKSLSLENHAKNHPAPLPFFAEQVQIMVTIFIGGYRCRHVRLLCECVRAACATSVQRVALAPLGKLQQ